MFIYNRQFAWKKYHETPTIWGLSNSNKLFWEGRRDANFTTQNTWIDDNKYTSGKNRVSQTITSNCMKILKEIAEKLWFEPNMTWRVALHGFPGWRVNILAQLLISCPVFQKCDAMADLFVWFNLRFLKCSFVLVSKLLFVYPTVNSVKKK